MGKQSGIEIYQTEDGKSVQVQLNRDTLWLNLSQIATLFDRDKSVISRHLKSIFDTGELARTATVAKHATVQLNTCSGRGLLDISYRYTQTFLWLQRYDEGLLEEPSGQLGGRLPSAEDASLALGNHTSTNKSR